MYEVRENPNEQYASEYPFVIFHRGSEWGGYLFHDRERAERVAAVQNAVDAADMDSVPSTLSRQEYESHCLTLGVEPRTDEECDSYGVHYGDYNPFHNDALTIIAYALHRRRLRGIERERANEPEPQRIAVQMIECDCGHTVEYGLVMSASLGRVCPDCYDDWSN